MPALGQSRVLLDRRPSDVNSEFHEFTTDALHAPEAVLSGHLLDQGDGFVRYPRAPTPVAGLEPPEQPETLAMPAKQRIGFDDKEGFLPPPGPAGEEDEPRAIGWCEAWLANLTVEDDELLAEEGVLGNDFALDPGIYTIAVELYLSTTVGRVPVSIELHIE